MRVSDCINRIWPFPAVVGRVCRFSPLMGSSSSSVCDSRASMPLREERLL